MTSNYIYLLQEREFIKSGEKVYKIGKTTKENHTRFNQYPKGSILLYQIICKDCNTLEKRILNEFKLKFNLKKEYGNEYFEGDYKLMIEVIYLLWRCETSINETSVATPSSFSTPSVATPSVATPSVATPSVEYVQIERNIFGYCLRFIDTGKTFEFNEDEYPNETKYFNFLLDKNIIKLGEIYNINSIEFIEKINKTKIHIHLEFNEVYQKGSEKFKELFLSDICINNNMYFTTIYDRNDDSERSESECSDPERNEYKRDERSDSERSDIEKSKNFWIEPIHTSNNFLCVRPWLHVYKYNSNYFLYNHLRKYIPYLVRYDEDGNYYFINREYHIIGEDKYSEVKMSDDVYLFDDESSPWDTVDGEKNLIELSKRYKYHKSRKNFVNIHKFTEELMNTLITL